MITLYGIKNCSTMKKAFDYLDQHQIEYQFHNYKSDKINQELINFFLTLTSWETLINKRGTTWRNLPPEIKDNMNESLAVEAMLDNPSIIKRPFLIEQDSKGNIRFELGFSEAQYNQFFNLDV